MGAWIVGTRCWLLLVKGRDCGPKRMVWRPRWEFGAHVESWRIGEVAERENFVDWAGRMEGREGWMSG